ncbi:MAG: class I SAM-dependent methyltransferase [Candidatus Omnitrophica bacterium]|nr:class I SAM-dependent methyltransferase [Candidatus Omnitrophota bacterium]
MPPNTTKIKEFFDTQAEAYDSARRLGHINYPGGQYFRKQLSEIVNPFIKGEMKVLEFGAGTGAYTYIFSNTDSKVVSLDISLEMLLESKKKNPDSHFVVADAHNLPFKKGSFDLVVGVNAFSYFSNKDKALSEIKDVLGEGGRIIICDMNGYSPLWNLVKTGRQKEVLVYLPQSNRKFLRTLFQSYRIKILSLREFSWIPYWANRWMVYIFRPIEAALTKVPLLKRLALRILIIGEKIAN